MHPNDPGTESAMEPSEQYTTIEVAKLLGMAVRSVQLMVDRGELDAWKTPGGHRRIPRSAVERWRHAHALPGAALKTVQPPPSQTDVPDDSVSRVRVLLIEDSIHFQNLISLVIRRHYPDVDLKIASDGITGLALYGQIQPDVLIVDILLPGIDGATLITTLRSHAQFARSQLIVVTSLDEAQREPFALALEGVKVIHKPQLVADLPLRLAEALSASK